MTRLTVFYDSRCPLCMAEIRQLDALNADGQLQLEDIHGDDFSQRYPHIDPQQADRVLHGQLEDGRMIYGLDVTAEAWSRVGKYRWLKVLRWPLLRQLSDLVYRLFARYRHPLARLLTGKSRADACNDERCKFD